MNKEDCKSREQLEGMTDEEIEAYIGVLNTWHQRAIIQKANLEIWRREAREVLGRRRVKEAFENR